MPSSSAASRSCMRWKVVQAVPSPRERAASMKLQAAGMIEPNIEATSGFGLPSKRPRTHGITGTGTSWRGSARWAEGLAMRALRPPAGPAAALGVGMGALPPQLGERRALAGVGDDHEVPVLGVARSGGLLREQ